MIPVYTHFARVTSFNLLGLTVPAKSVTKYFHVWHVSSSSLIPVYTIHLPTVNVCTKFQPSRPHSSWEKCDKKFYVWKLERKKKEKLKGRISAATWFWYTRYIHPLSTCVTSFNLFRPHSSGERCEEKFSCLKIGEKEKWKINGWISSSSLILIYTIHLSTVHKCLKLQPFRPHSSWEKCDENFQCLKIGEKEKWRNKGTNMQQQPDSGIHDSSAHCPRVYQVSIF